MEKHFVTGFMDELSKIAQHPEGIPVGSKYRSKGQGRGLGRGGGYGPMGVPADGPGRPKGGKEMAQELSAYIQQAGGDVKAGVKAYNEARNKK